ncbi:MAG: hypothetical protein V1773_09545 [bacterium]
MKKLKENHFLYFLSKLFILLFFVAIFDFSVGSILHKLYFNQKSGALYRTTYSLEKTTAKLLIFGSSKATFHYNPLIFQDELNISCYNVGRNANFIFYHFAILKGVLKRYTPEIIILDLVHGEFESQRDSYDRLSALLPYYKDHPELHSIIEMKSPFEKYKLFSNIYPYNSTLFTTVVKSLTTDSSIDINGFTPVNNIWKEPIKIETDLESGKFDYTKIKYFKSFIDLCNKKGIKLFIIVSPYFFKSHSVNPTISLAKNIAANKNITFYDFSKDTTYTNHNNYFKDPLHLNIYGAEIFSKMIAKKLKAEININN